MSHAAAPQRLRGLPRQLVRQLGRSCSWGVEVAVEGSRGRGEVGRGQLGLLGQHWSPGRGRGGGGAPVLRLTADTLLLLAQLGQNRETTHISDKDKKTYFL